MEILKNRKRKDREPRRRAAQKRITCAVLGALFVVAAATGVYIANKDTMTLRETVLISTMGDKQEYRGKTRLYYQKKTGEVTMENGGRPFALPGNPVYCPDSESLVLSRKMTYSNYETGMMRRVNHFARISRENEIIRIQTGGRSSHEVTGGYLFDGENTYLFLDPMTITWGEETLSLEPFSYISVFNKQGFYYYSWGNGAAAYVSSQDEVVRATAPEKSYGINLSSDIAELSDGRLLLLSPSPDAFELLK